MFYDKEFFDHIENDMLFFKNVYHFPVCMMSDYNSRTSTLDDFPVCMMSDYNSRTRSA